LYLSGINFYCINPGKGSVCSGIGKEKTG